MFSAAFSGEFAGVGGYYIAPMAAQAALVAGVAAVVVRSTRTVKVGGGVLIGQAGGEYQFASPENAAEWIAATRAAGVAEAVIVAGLSPAAAAGYKARKRAKLARRAELCIAAAARQESKGKRRALVVEAGIAAGKWA